MELIRNERVDDIPLILNQMKKISLDEIIDQHFKAHGNWKGLSIGNLAVGWIAYIVSEGDHRLSRVEDWAEGSLETLQASLHPGVRSLDFSDDHLAQVLDHLSNDVAWEDCDGQIAGKIIRVYDLRQERVRIDSTTVSGHWEEGELFAFGKSKDNRLDLVS